MIKKFTPARLPILSRRKVSTVQSKERSSGRVVSAKFLQCNGEQSTVVTSSSGNDNDILECGAWVYSLIRG